MRSSEALRTLRRLLPPPPCDYLCMPEALDDFHALKALRQARAVPTNRKGRPFTAVAEGLGLVRKGQR